MKAITINLTLAILVTALLQAVASAAELSAHRSQRQLHGIVFTGDPGAMHQVLISFETLPGESERARVRELGGRVRHAYRLVPAICAHLPEAGVQTFAQRPGVMRIEADGRARAIEKLLSASGVERIRAGIAHGRNVTGTGVGVAGMNP
jgi:hypothetical protein